VPDKNGKQICGEKYEFSISAINSAGNGPYSAPEVGFCGLKNVLVRNLKVSEIGTNWAEIIWDAPLYQQNIKKFDVLYTINGEDEREITVDRDSRSLQLEHLAANSELQFWISFWVLEILKSCIEDFLLEILDNLKKNGNFTHFSKFLDILLSFQNFWNFY